MQLEGRNRRIVSGIVSGVLVKVVTVSVTLLMVPITLNYLGQERYGVWVTMISLLAWLGMVDLGLANGLTPTLSAAFGEKRLDLARAYIATAIWSLTAISVLAAGIAGCAWLYIDWAYVFNTDDPELASEISRAIAAAGLLFLCQLPLSVNQRVLLAFQEGKTANLVQLLVSVSGSLGIYLVTISGGGLLWLVLGYYGTQLVGSLLSTAWIYGVFKPELNPLVRPDFSQTRNVLSMGGLFFVLQLCTLVFFQKDNLLITHYLGAHEAAIYSLVWQMFLYLNAIGLLLSPYIAPGFGEAIAARDGKWVRETFRRYLATSVGFTVIAALTVAVFHRPLLRLWTGQIIEPDLSLVIFMALWAVLLSVMNPVVALLLGSGKLRSYAKYSVAAASFSIVLSIILLQYFGATGVIAATCISFFFILAIPGFNAARRVVLAA